MDELKNCLQHYSNGSGVFVQIGSGAGDLDMRANYRDGFTEFIKNLPRDRIKKIILVEPNPLNISLLKECWKDYPEAIIYQLCVVTENYIKDEVDLFYCPDDAPHYQVASIKIEHIRKHYGQNCILNKFTVNTKKINNFLKEITDGEIELLSLDVEGIDGELLLDIDFQKLNINFLSFEYLHLGDKEKSVKEHLINNNFKYIGIGLDHNGYDYLYRNKMFIINNLLHPITFSIPEEKILNYVPKKNKILSNLIPGDLTTYIYNNETDYYNEYRQSMFAITKKKGGWDCMRHYEIIANGCIPYFIDIEHCPENTMALLPKNLLLEGNDLYNTLKNKNIDEINIDELNIYETLVKKFIDYTKKYLTTKSIAEYILTKTNNCNVTKILYLSGSTAPDYLRCLTLHGFKELLGNNCHDYPKIPHIYKSNNINIETLYGKGISYTNLLDDQLHDYNLDNNIEESIKSKYYDIIIYGSYHRGTPYYYLVNKIYKPNEIILICGEDCHYCDHNNWTSRGHYVFVRELE